MKTIAQKGLETVGLEIRSLNGRDALFTTDGKLLANQAEGEGFFWYAKDDEGRHKTFRATFVIDNRTVRTGQPYEQGQDQSHPNGER